MLSGISGGWYGGTIALMVSMVVTVVILCGGVDLMPLLGGQYLCTMKTHTCSTNHAYSGTMHPSSASAFHQ